MYSQKKLTEIALLLNNTFRETNALAISRNDIIDITSYLKQVRVQSQHLLTVLAKRKIFIAEGWILCLIDMYIQVLVFYLP